MDPCAEELALSPELQRGAHPTRRAAAGNTGRRPPAARPRINTSLTFVFFVLLLLWERVKGAAAGWRVAAVIYVCFL